MALSTENYVNYVNYVNSITFLANLDLIVI